MPVHLLRLIVGFIMVIVIFAVGLLLGLLYGLCSSFQFSWRTFGKFAIGCIFALWLMYVIGQLLLVM